MIEILGALKFLHAHKWMHGDLKPTNVGVRDQNADRLQIVLLDMDEAIPVPSIGKIQCTPGMGGTVGWVSPEREMTDYDESCDLWALGVLILWLVNGEHPWPFAVNPWRPGQKYEELRPRFHNHYQDTMTRLERWHDKGQSRLSCENWIGVCG